MEASFGRPPDPATLGYEAALNAGFAAAEAGVSALALSYFTRAAELRSTSIALAQQGKCLRNLGRHAEALDALLEAHQAPGGSRGHVRVSLITALCDMRRYEEALPLATQAQLEEPDNAAVLKVTARVLEELSETLSRGSVNGGELSGPLAQARRMRARARELDGARSTERAQQRRDRAFPLHSVMPAVERTVPVEQPSQRAIGWRLAPEPGAPQPSPAPPAEATTQEAAAPAVAATLPPCPAVTTAKQHEAPGRLRQWLRRVLRGAAASPGS
jgi:tetratricopeptide (TPR) repeat protein